MLAAAVATSPEAENTSSFNTSFTAVQQQSAPTAADDNNNNNNIIHQQQSTAHHQDREGCFAREAAATVPPAGSSADLHGRVEPTTGVADADGAVVGMEIGKTDEAQAKKLPPQTSSAPAPAPAPAPAGDVKGVKRRVDDAALSQPFSQPSVVMIPGKQRRTKMKPRQAPASA